MRSRILASGLLSLGLIGVVGTAARERRAPAGPRASPSAWRDPFRHVDPLSCARVLEIDRAGRAVEVRGVRYAARVTGAGMALEADGLELRTGVTRIEQGGRVLVPADGTATRPMFARARIDRGQVVEEYAFENRRVEQIFRILRPVGEGALRVFVALHTGLGGPVIEVPRSAGGLVEPMMRDGGLWFCDAAGRKRLAYHGAQAIDAAGRALPLDIRYADREAVIEVPEAFMAEASFPLTVDPWVAFGISDSPGGITNDALESHLTSMALDPAGNPVVAWTKGNPNLPQPTSIHVRAWDGAAWTPLAGSGPDGLISDPSVNGQWPSIAIDGAGTVVVAWQAVLSAANHEVYLRRWSPLVGWDAPAGSDSLGGVSGTATFSAEPSVAVRAPGTIVVTWWEGTIPVPLGSTSADGDIFVKTLSGEAWVGMNGVPGGDNLSVDAFASDQSKVALDSLSRPVVAWRNSPGPHRIFLKRWTGVAWVELDGSASGIGISDNVGTSQRPAVALDALDSITVAWENYSGAFGGPSEIFLKRHAGAGWLPLAGAVGPSSASDGGISATPDRSFQTGLALDAAGRPIVSWSDGPDATHHQIYIRRWTGTGWVQLSGSATGGGISGSVSPHSSRESNVAFDPDGNPVVAWTEFEGDGEVHALRWLQEPPSALQQRRHNGATILPLGANAPRQAVVFRGIVTSGDVSDAGGAPALPDVRLEVEVRIIGAGPDCVRTGESALVASGAQASLLIEDIPRGPARWRARTKDALGHTSAWVDFGGNPDTAADFVVHGGARDCGP